MNSSSVDESYFVSTRRLVAQLHDELLYEVEDGEVRAFAGKFPLKLHIYGEFQGCPEPSGGQEGDKQDFFIAQLKYCASFLHFAHIA